MKTRTISQGNLTAECWTVQLRGTESCDECEYRDTEECGGKEIRLSGRNNKGIEVPLS